MQTMDKPTYYFGICIRDTDHSLVNSNKGTYTYQDQGGMDLMSGGTPGLRWL